MKLWPVPDVTVIKRLGIRKGVRDEEEVHGGADRVRSAAGGERDADRGDRPEDGDLGGHVFFSQGKPHNGPARGRQLGSPSSMSQAGIVTVFVATRAWLVQVVTKSSLEFALSLRATWLAVPPKLAVISPHKGVGLALALPYA